MWQRKEIKKSGKRQLFRNWAAMVAVCFILAFTGAEFAGSVDFIGEFDPSAMLPDDQVVIQQVSLSNWELMLEWLHIDPMDGTHPMWAAADQNAAPLFDAVTAPFSAFFALLERSQFAGWLDITLAVVGIAGGVWFSVWVLGALTVGSRRFFLESRVRDNISISAMFAPFGRGKWWNVTKAMLLRSIYQLLWCFTVIGFPIKYYSYRMVPYILAENRRSSPPRRSACPPDDGRQQVALLCSGSDHLSALDVHPHGDRYRAGHGGRPADRRDRAVQSIAAALTGVLSLLFVNGYRSASYTAVYAALRQAQLDAGAPGSDAFIVPAFGEAMPEGKKPRLPDADVHLPADRCSTSRRSTSWTTSGITASARSSCCSSRSRSRAGCGRSRCTSSPRACWSTAAPCSALAADLRRSGALVLFLLKKLFTRPVATFFVSMALCSVIEYFTSWYLEYTKGIRWWDYSGYFMNLNGRICLEGAVIFGLACCAVVYFAGPLIGGLIDKLSPAAQNTLCAVLVALFAADAVYSHFHPNQGAGITDYNDWQADESAAEAALTASSAPKHG